MEAKRLADNTDGPAVMEAGPGSWTWWTKENGGPISRWFVFCLPDESLCVIPVAVNQGLRTWRWDGSIEAPTLSPSIRSGNDDGEVWHGWIKIGEFVETIH